MPRCLLLVQLLLIKGLVVNGQWTSQTFPDPRIDPGRCHIPGPGLVCDPSGIIDEPQRIRLTERINQLLLVTSGIKNTSPHCEQYPGRSLQVIVAVLDKIGVLPVGTVDIEKFSNNLKRRYQQYQDVGICDTMVLVVNSRRDSQVYTVAGRDTKLTKTELRQAFERNIEHFKSRQFGTGLEGMIEMIIAAYNNAHILQVSNNSIQPPGGSRAAGTELTTSRSLRDPGQHQPPPQQNNDSNEDDEKLWFDVMKLAANRCGHNRDRFLGHVRTVVEEAMSLSLRLIGDARYNSIEEEVERGKDQPDARARAWRAAEPRFLTATHERFINQVLSAGQLPPTCPNEIDPFLLRRRFRNRRL